MPDPPGWAFVLFFPFLLPFAGPLAFLIPLSVAALASRFVFSHFFHSSLVTYLIYSYILILLSVCHGGRVRHRRPIGPGPALPDSRIFTDRACCGGVGLGPSQKAGRLSGPLHGRNMHGHSLVPSTGEAWPGGGALRCCRRNKRRRRTEEKREERS